MKYLRRELNQVEKEYLKQFGQDSLNCVVLHDPNTKDKQEVQDTIDILKEAMDGKVDCYFSFSICEGGECDNTLLNETFLIASGYKNKKL